ncbi:MAG: hypothetical protein ACYCVB_04170 [Bacilli bacterium]
MNGVRDVVARTGLAIAAVTLAASVVAPMAAAASGTNAKPTGKQTISQHARIDSARVVVALTHMRLNRSDLVYNYLEFTKIPIKNVFQIERNARTVKEVFAAANSTVAKWVPFQYKAEAVRLLFESANLAGLSATFVNGKGQPVNWVKYRFNTPVSLRIDSASGHYLANMNINPWIVAPGNIEAYVNDIETVAANAAYLEKLPYFVPMS